MSKLHVVEPMKIGVGDNQTDFTETLRRYFSGKMEDYGALAILDCAGFGQIPNEAWAIGRRLPYKINIDHHVGYTLDCPEDGILNLVGNCSSASEVLFHLMQELDVEIDSEIAVPLYIGIIADLRKNEVSKESPQFPRDAIKALSTRIKEVDAQIRGQIKDIFSLDPWEKYFLKMIIDRIRFKENIVHVTFNRAMVNEAKRATDSLHNYRMPFHEFHIRLRRELRRFRKEFQVVAIFDQILGKVSLYDLHKDDRFDLAALSSELGNGGGHLNRAGFSFQSAREKLMNADIIEAGLSEEMIMDKMVDVIRVRLAEMAQADM
jgi:nanoRNase/pAp phosphatase (c-di-AMP/oligoRNAs hydrolase)